MWDSNRSAMRRVFFTLALSIALSPLPAVVANPLTLDEALRLAQADAPGLRAQHARVEAAHSLIGPAGQLPDPQLLLGIENVPLDGAERGSLTRDSMTMQRLGASQTFTRRAKRDAQVASAGARTAMAQAELQIAELVFREQVAQSWIKVSAAEQRIALLTELHQQWQAQVAAADAALATGRSSVADALQARSLLSVLDDRRIGAERDRLLAREELRRWLPASADRPLASAPDFTDLPYARDQMLAKAGQHRGLLTLDAEQALVDAEVASARAARLSDWSLDVAYGQRGAEFSNTLSVGLRIDLPIFQRHRQDPVIAAKLAEHDAFAAEREDMLRAHLAELRTAIAIWESARSSAMHYDAEVIPMARDRAATALAAWRGGGSSLSQVLLATMDLIEQQIVALTRKEELGMAWAHLHFAFTEES